MPEPEVAPDTYAVEMAQLGELRSQVQHLLLRARDAIAEDGRLDAVEGLQLGHAGLALANTVVGMIQRIPDAASRDRLVFAATRSVLVLRPDPASSG